VLYLARKENGRANLTTLRWRRDYGRGFLEREIFVHPERSQQEKNTMPNDTTTLDPVEIKKNLDTIVKAVETTSTALEGVNKTVTEVTKANAEHDKKLGAVEAKLNDLNKTLTELKSVRVVTETPSRRGIVKSQAQAVEFMSHILAMVKNTGGSLHNIGKGFIKDLAEGSSNTGGALVHPEFDTALTRLIEDYGFFRRCRVIPMGRKQTLLPVESSFPSASFIAEAGTITPDTTTPFAQKTITAKKIAIIRNISRELLADSEIITPDIVEVIMLDLAWAIAKRIDFAVFNGDGTDDANNGGITGVTVAGTQVTCAAATTFATVTRADLVSAMSAVNPKVLESETAGWYCSSTVALKTFRGMLDGNNRPLYQNYLDAPFTGNQPFRAALNVEGFPLYTSNILNSTDGASKVVAVFGDLRFFTVGLRQDVEFESSPYPYWTKDQMSYRAIARVGGSITDATGLAVLSTHA
jgi:HK97 family phage major capsid protein